MSGIIIVAKLYENAVFDRCSQRKLAQRNGGRRHISFPNNQERRLRQRIEPMKKIGFFLFSKGLTLLQVKYMMLDIEKYRIL